MSREPTVLRIYIDTSATPENCRPKEPVEYQAVQKLTGQSSLSVQSSRFLAHEVSRTSDPRRRELLQGEAETIKRVVLDEKLLGFNVVFDQYGGFVSSPMMADVQDEPVLAELIERGLDPMDARHIAQARSNGCDMFLTRDRDILKKHRKWLEERFPGLRFRLPTELAAELGL